MRAEALQRTAWADRLPSLLDRLSEKWGPLEIGEPFPGRRSTFVAPVSDKLGRAMVLKLWRDSRWAIFEYEALVHWDGKGCVRPLGFEEEYGAILEERIFPGHSLRSSSLSDSDRTLAFIDVARRLREVRRDVPSLPHLRTWLDRLRVGRLADEPPDLSEQLRLAGHVAGQLLVSSSADTVLHADLHHRNLLFAEGEHWVAIDPKGIIGPPEVEAAAFLRGPRQLVLDLDDPVSTLSARTNAIAAGLGLRADLLAGWAYVMGVLSAAWALEDGEGSVEVSRWLQCAMILEEMYRRMRTS